MKIVLLFLAIFVSSSASAQGYLGTWVVDKIAASHISNLTVEEASSFIGHQLNYQNDQASSGSGACSEISYREELFSERELHSYHKVFFSDLGAQDIEQVSNIEVFCNNKPWYEFGAFIIQAGSKVFISYSGYVYELRSKNT